MLTAEKIAEWSDGVWVGGLPPCINGFSIDTRLIEKGDIFIALSGDNRDGHDYLDVAFERGAAAAIVAKDRYNPATDYGRYLLVKDPAEALINIATAYRKSIGAKIIAVTGSVGKSTVKELVAQMLETTFKTAKTKGNWNNNIGLPLSIMAMDEDTEVAVFELGMNHPGELEELCRIVEPDYSIITNVGPVHLEFFDSVKAIAEEKAILLKQMSGNGVAVLDYDGDFFELFNDYVVGERMTVSLHNEADYYFIYKDVKSGGVVICEKCSGNEITLPMPLPGSFNILNVLFAVAVVRRVGVGWDDIIHALENYDAMPMRWNKVEVNDRLFINDAYNANPISMRAAIETFYNEHKSESRWLILGGMLELGDIEIEEHKALGKYIAAMEWAGLVVVGRLGRLIADSFEESGMTDSAVFRCDNIDDVVEVIAANVASDSAVLLKGSRGFKLEGVIDKLKRTGGK